MIGICTKGIEIKYLLLRYVHIPMKIPIAINALIAITIEMTAITAAPTTFNLNEFHKRGINNHTCRCTV